MAASTTLLDSPITQCIVIYLFHFFISSFLIGFTGPYSILRIAALPIQLSLTWLIFTTCSDTPDPTFWTALLGGSVVGWTLQYLEVILLSRWDFERHGPATRASDQTGESRAYEYKGPLLAWTEDTIWNRFCFGNYVNFTFRHCGTPYEVKNVTPFSARDPQYVPSRTTFVLKTTLATFLGLLFLDFSGMAKQDVEPFSAKYVPIFGTQIQITAQQLGLRLVSTVMFWIILYLFLLVTQGTVSIVTVATALCEVGSWRPAFGPLTKIYSVRKFWGAFWHQHNRQKFAGIAELVIHDVMRIPQGTLIARYGKILATFVISGYMHAVSDILAGMTWAQSGAVRFFVTQAFGIIVEDAIQAVYRSLKGGKRSDAAPKMWVKFLGYAWVVIFLTWSTPVWFYPTVGIHGADDKPAILPFSIISWVKSL